MKRYLKYFIKGFIIFIGLVVVFYIIVLAYVSAHKKAIIKQVTEKVSKEINGSLSIGDIELNFFRTFPKVSVLLNKVVITDSLFSKHHHPFFEGEEIFAQLNIANLIKKQFAVDGLKIVNANIYLFTDNSGYTNEYLLSSKKNIPSDKNKATEKNELNFIDLKNVRVILDDKKKGKLYNILAKKLNIRIDDKDSFLLVSSKSDMLIHDLSFNLAKGSFVKEKTFEGKFEVRFNKFLHQLSADSINIKIAGQPFNVSGNFDLQGPAPQFNLRVHTKNILYDFAKSLLPEKISSALSIVNLDKKINVDAIINGPLKGGDPVIVVKWEVKKSNLTTPFLDFSNATFSGFFTNEVDTSLPRKDANSKIQLNNFSADWNGLPVTSNHIEILNLYQPLLTADLKSNFALATLNNMLGSNSIQLTHGKGSANLTYRGPLERNNNTNSFVNGVITFSDGTIWYAPREIEMKNANGKLIFKNSDVSVTDLQCVVLDNKVTMNGHANNLLTLMNTGPNRVNIDWNIYSSSLNLSPFIYLLKPGKKVNRSNNKKAKLGKISAKIDDILDQGSLDVHLKTDRLQYKKFEAENVTAHVSLFSESYEIHQVSMLYGGGRLDLSGSLVNRNSNFHQVTFHSAIKNVEVNKIFSTFNNFGQNGIEANNLEGKLSAKADGTFGLNNNGEVYPGSVASTIDFSLKDGVLKNFEPIKKVQNFLFKNRDFENIQFAELKDILQIANEEVRINRMEMASTVFTIFVEGVYSTKGNTDLSVQIPLSNLKKRSADYDPKNSDVTKKTGSSLFLRGRPGSDGNIQFKVDLFNGFKRSKEKEK
ncbi:MAG: AsmA-like C-terminal region-containing protein [Ginsengibacter sp.]